MSLMPSAPTSEGRSSVTAPTKPTSTATEVLDPGAVQGRRVVGLELHVGAEVLPLRATLGVRGGVVRRHDPVDQVVVARVELVVAHGRHVQPGLVHHVDGRLVVLDEGLERRRTDQVTRGREHGVGVGLARSLDVRREARTRGQAAVVVVAADDLDVRGRGRRVLRLQTQEHRVVVGGAVGTRGVEVRRVVVPAAVLQGERLAAVDVPDVGARRARERGVVHQDVVERAGEAGERVGVLAVGEVLLHVGEVGVVEDLQRVLHGVGVEVATQDDGLHARLGLQASDPVAQRRRLQHAGAVGRTLAVAAVGVARVGTGRALGLEVVDDEEERVAARLRLEHLAQRLARVVERLTGVAQGAERTGLTHTVDAGGLVDDRVGDHVHAVGRELGRGRVGRPGAGTGVQR